MGFPSSDWRTIADSFHNVAAYSPGTDEFRTATLAFGSVTTRITAQGLRLLKTLDQPVHDLHKRQFRHLPAARLKTLSELLEEVRTRKPE